MTGRDSKPLLLPLDDFVQGLIKQLDEVQDALAIKIRAGRPMSWALRDVRLDLNVFLGANADGTVTIRSAAPNEQGASTVHLELTTIAREHVEENAWHPQDDEDPRSLRSFGDVVGMPKEEVARLERLGLRTVGQVDRAVRQSSEHWISERAGVSKNNLHSCLRAARRPAIQDVQRSPFGDKMPLVRLLGVHLSDGRQPEVKLCGEPVQVLSASNNEVTVRPAAHHQEGPVELTVGGERTTGWLSAAELGAAAPAPMERHPIEQQPMDHRGAAPRSTPDAPSWNGRSSWGEGS